MAFTDNCDIFIAAGAEVAPQQISIDLVEPDDGPEGAREPKIAGWRKRSEQQVESESDNNTPRSTS